MKEKKIFRKTTAVLLVIAFVLSMTMTAFGAVTSVSPSSLRVKISPYGMAEHKTITVGTNSAGWTAHLDKTGQGVSISRPGGNMIHVTITPGAKAGKYVISVKGFDGIGKTVTLEVIRF